MRAFACLGFSDVREVLSRVSRNEGLCAADNFPLTLPRLLPFALVEGPSRDVVASAGELSVLLRAATLEHLHEREAWLPRPELERFAWVQVRALSINSR